MNCQITKQNNDPEKRKYAIQSIEAMVREIGFANEKLNEEVIDRIFSILGRTVEDYTMDKRGDIGSIVREESMSAMIHIVQIYCEATNKKWIISDAIITKMIALFLQQLNEKIDRVRLLAGSLLQTFFDHYANNFKIPHSNSLFEIFGQDNIKKLVQ